MEDEGGARSTQLLSSSSVAVSTSQDFDDNATITAFCGGKQNQSHMLIYSARVSHHDSKQERQDFETLTFSKPMAQSLSILRVYSGLETGAPA